MILFFFNFRHTEDSETKAKFIYTHTEDFTNTSNTDGLIHKSTGNQVAYSLTI